MWRTSLGDRTLIPAEARLFSAGVRVLIDALAMDFDEHWREDDTVDYPTGVAQFDVLTPTQRIGSIHRVTKYLLTQAGPTPEVSAIEEATIAAIFMEIRDQLAIEVDFRDSSDVDPDATYAAKQESDRHSWRELVLQAYLSIQQLDSDKTTDSDAELEQDEFLPNATIDSGEMNVWDAIIERLIDGILWDRDFEMADLFLDADPGVIKQRREMLGIRQDYFSDVAAEPSPTQLAQMIAETRRLTQVKPR